MKQCYYRGRREVDLNVKRKAVPTVTHTTAIRSALTLLFLGANAGGGAGGRGGRDMSAAVAQFLSSAQFEEVGEHVGVCMCAGGGGGRGWVYMRACP